MLVDLVSSSATCFSRCYAFFSRKQPENRRAKVGWLGRSAVALENVRILNAIRVVDFYGRSAGPKWRRRTVVGGIVSVMFITALIILNVLNLVQLLQRQRAVTTGASIFLNPRNNVGFTVYGLFGRVGVDLNFPVLDLSISNDILFFEADKPSIQKILVMDNTFYNPTFTTNFSDPPITKSMYTQKSIPFNSVEFDMPGSNPTVIVDIHQMIIAQLPSKFTQEIQALALIKLYEAVTSDLFYPHNVSVYIRFQKSQLQQLLDYQLDVTIFNTGEWKNSKYHSLYSSLQTLTTDSTLHNITQVDPNFNVLVLRNSLDYNTSSDFDAVNWNIGIQYTSNFNYTLPEFVCYNEESNTLNVSTFDAIAWINPPVAGDRTLQIVDSKLIWDIPRAPFSIVILNHALYEKVLVTDVVGNTLILKSPITNDFNATTTSCESNIEDYFWLFPTPSALPSTVSTRFYGKMDANQWYHQTGLTGCECIGNIPSLACYFCSDAKSYTLRFDGYVCDLHGDKNDTVQPPYVAVVMVCDYADPILVGESLVSGYFGIPEQGSILQCPDDGYFEGEAQVHADKTTWCNERPKVELSFSYRSPSVYKEYTKMSDFPFHATLSLGAFNYTVAIETFEGRIYISGLPPPSTCDSSNQAIPEYGFTGYLLPPTPGSALLALQTSDTSYLPTIGPYSINVILQEYVGLTTLVNIAEWSLQVVNAFCPDENGLQKILLPEPLPFDLLQKVKSDYVETTVTELALKGQNYIKVWYSEDFMTPICDYHSQYYLEPVLIGAGWDIFSFDVNRLVYNGTGESLDGCFCSCDTNSIITIFSYNGLPVTVLPGTSVSYALAMSGPGPVSHYPLLEALPIGNTPAYQTEERSRSFPVPDLEIEIAAFIVPEKKDFEEFSKLCEVELPITPINKNWTLTRFTTVQDCQISAPTSFSGQCYEFGCDTSSLMSPTNLFHYTQNIPINDKWAPNTDFNGVDSPEYFIDTSTVYYFDYTDNDLSMGRQFSANVPEQGDFDQHGNRMEFSGEMDFIGRSTSNDAKFSLYPANSPILNFRVEIIANKTATKQFVAQSGQAFQGIWNVIGWTLDTVDYFEPLTIEWPNQIPLNLQPGFNYTFKASVSIQPSYDVGIVGGTAMSGWRSSYTTSFEKASASFTNRANVRVQIEFVREVAILENRVVYNFFDFVASLGSSIGLFSIGLIVMTVWQKLTMRQEVLIEEDTQDINPYYLKKEYTPNEGEQTTQDTEMDNIPNTATLIITEQTTTGEASVEI